MMANGTLVRTLIHTDVTKYLSFKAVDGSFVFSKGKVHKVPATDMEALKSPLMGLFEKRRARNFFIYVQDYNEADPKTHQGLDLTTVTTRELISKYGLSDDTVDFIGHALALHRDDRYLNEPALDTVKRMKLYAESLARFQGGSPYIYPLYGLGELPQAFARLSAVYGGTYMLNKPECKVEFDMEGKVCGVTSEGETAKCKKVRKIGKVARAIAIMSHPIPNTNESHSVQIILPQKQLGRKSDMYVFCCSYTHNVAPKGKFIAFVSAEAETENPQSELKPGIDLLGPVDELFFDMYDRYEPVNEPSLDNCFVSMSYDATTHFETTVADVLNMYTAITGKQQAAVSPSQPPVMDEEYDVIVLGTGLKECILSGLLSVDGLKEQTWTVGGGRRQLGSWMVALGLQKGQLQVLHMDRNDYYGGDSTSLNLNQLWKKFRGEDKPPAHLGASRDYNVDMVPKFMMANGTLVRTLIHTDVTKYLSFKAVDGSYVFSKGKIHKVPATDMEALKSPLMGLFEKRRARNFFIYVQDYNEADPKTHQGLDLTRVSTRELIAKYGLSDDTVDFIGHALALHRDDRYLDEPALDTVKRMKGFARLSAVYGGTYMLNKPECKVEFDMEGKVCGVTSEGETAKCKKVVCDPSYLPNKVRKIGRVIRAIAIMSHPIPNTNESHSVQIILPQKQLGRKSDMYVFCCSYTHNVAPRGKFIAFVSAEAETDNPQSELKPGVDLLGSVDEIFYDIYDRYEPVNEPSLDNCFVSTSYDASTHFETTVTDVLNMYTMITGKTVDLSVDLSAASAAEEY
ncbi:hypothetical protein PR202_ga04694 [Eleusine coracana subsp. coracana]|uniref:Guanosine nucleotide diphosphate dissociation inhibitor n=1 Tax=Eleusine coracana subsp. coracana TaxID=191504 RepID=A0AAV5BTL9_ELECO|nr:hypothetical protein PR202_ga04694 [Eleusine coracana subsp. coracana]